MHLHASALDALVIAAYLLIILFIIRGLIVRYPDSTISKGLAFIAG